jgi:hypothetical protein
MVNIVVMMFHSIVDWVHIGAKTKVGFWGRCSRSLVDSAYTRPKRYAPGGVDQCRVVCKPAYARARCRMD